MKFSRNMQSTSHSSKPSDDPSDLQFNKPSTFPSIAPSSMSTPPICSNLKGWKCKKEKKNECNWERVTESCYDKDDLPARSTTTVKLKCNKTKDIHSNCA